MFRLIIEQIRKVRDKFSESKPIRAYRYWKLKRNKEQTFRLEQNAEGKTIRCLVCMRLSYFRFDIENKYCSFCGLFHLYSISISNKMIRLLR